MQIRLSLSLLLLALVALPASAFTPFLDLGGLPGQDLAATARQLEAALEGHATLRVLGSHGVTGPDIVRERESRRDGRGGMLLLLEDESLSAALVAADARYFLGALQRVGIYHDAAGGQRVTCLDPEFHVRVIANDLTDQAAYDRLAGDAAAARDRLVTAVQEALGLDEVPAPIGAERDAARIREGKKDMFMMVGPLTYYRKDKQFPRIYDEPLGPDPHAQVLALAERLSANVAAYRAGSDEREYRWSADPVADTTWEVVAQLEAPCHSVLLGLTRPRTEALAGEIVGLSRDSDEDRSPGLDHLCAFPVEVLIAVEGDRVAVRTAREMYRMDLFFWDAGKSAFMKYAQMPAMLDRSLKKALLGK